MPYNSLKNACKKLNVDYSIFHPGKGSSLYKNASIQFNLKNHYIYNENGACVRLDFPQTLLYFAKYYDAEDIFLVWKRYDLGDTHTPNVNKAEVEAALKNQEIIHIVDHRQKNAYGPKSPVFVFSAEHAEEFLNQIVIPELSLTGITNIRLLPMGKEEFPSKEDVNNFILQDLKRYGLYYYKKHSFTDHPHNRIFVLFQYDGCLIGCGEKINQIIEQEDDYSGYYKFDKDTVQLFDKPILAKDFFSLVDHTIKCFNQALQKINLQYLERIVSYIEQNCFLESNADTSITEMIVCDSRPGMEGKQILYYGTRYERNPNLRRTALELCKQKNGALICEVCQTNYENCYGELGNSVMEVHHLKPLGQIKEEHDINPETDLVCLCANCHKVMHSAIRKYGHTLTATELKETVFPSKPRTGTLV